MDGVEAFLSIFVIGFFVFAMWMMFGYINTSQDLYKVHKELIKRGDMIYCATTGELKWTENCAIREGQ